MKKWVNKILSAVIAVVTLFTLSVTAFAVPVTVQPLSQDNIYLYATFSPSGVNCRCSVFCGTDVTSITNGVLIFKGSRNNVIVSKAGLSSSSNTLIYSCDAPAVPADTYKLVFNGYANTSTGSRFISGSSTYVYNGYSLYEVDSSFVTYELPAGYEQKLVYSFDGTLY